VTPSSTTSRLCTLPRGKVSSIDAPIPFDRATWKEIQELEEGKRKERIEAHKQSFLASISSPHAAEPKAPRKKGSKDSAEPKYIFKARDPVEVVSRLSQQQAAWEARLASGKRYQKSEVATKKPSKSSLELRAEEYASKALEHKQSRLLKVDYGHRIHKYCLNSP
jgi:hypothetical protein